MSCYIRSSDANLGLPSDLFHLYLIAGMIDVPLESISVTFPNVHIYDNNLENTKKLLAGEKVSFNLNV
jgi:thymidylate synthase